MWIFSIQQAGIYNYFASMCKCILDNRNKIIDFFKAFEEILVLSMHLIICVQKIQSRYLNK